MNRKVTLFIGAIAVIGSINCLPVTLFAEDQVFVEVTSTKLRTKPMFWAPTQQELKYGDALKVVPSEAVPEGWLQARTSAGKTGFVHGSAITTKRVVIKGRAGGQAGTEADEADIVLAGKGFSKEVEQQSSKRASARNYSAVNQMEQYRITDGEVLAFIKQGGLKH